MNMEDSQAEAGREEPMADPTMRSEDNATLRIQGLLPDVKGAIDMLFVVLPQDLVIEVSLTGLYRYKAQNEASGPDPDLDPATRPE